MQDPRAIEALRELGVRLPEDLDAVRHAPSFEAGQAKLAELKERARRNFKHLAFELHPDRTGGDPEKTERFKRIAQAHGEVEKLQLQRRPPVQQVFVMHQYMPFHAPTPVTSTSPYAAAYASTTNSTSANAYCAWQVAFIRPF